MAALVEENVILVDLESQSLIVPKSLRHIGVESDDGVKRLYFKCPRYHGEFDLSKFKVNINYMNALKLGDVYKVDDAVTANDFITFSWLVGRYALMKEGQVLFNVCLKFVEGDGENAEVLKEFNTVPYKVHVQEGLETTEQVIQRYPDLVETWQEELFGRFHGRVDDTLTIEGQAADAKVTGDNFKSLANDIYTVSSERAAEIAVERARIDQLKKLPNGSTTGDAELMDIRIGANAFTYDNAGDAVREQIKDVYMSVEDIAHGDEMRSLQLFDAKRLISGGYYDLKGAWVNEPHYTSSEFIDISKYVRVSINIPERDYNLAIIYGFYNADKKIIGTGYRHNLTTESFHADVNVPEGAVYFVISNSTMQYQYSIYGYIPNPILKLAKPKPFEGLKLSILGDSISTLTGYNPEGNEVYYITGRFGVNTVDDTWWGKVMNHTGMSLCMNESWSGATVSSARDPLFPGSSGVDRCENLDVNGVTPNVIIVYMGTNDFRNHVRLGEYNGTQEFPTNPATFREAYAIMLSKILTKYPNAMVYVCTLKQFENVGSVGFPDTNNAGLTIDDYTNAILDLATLFGCPVIDLNKSGLNYFNLHLYCGDYNYNTGLGLHPNVAGMTKIANRVIHDLIEMPL